MSKVTRVVVLCPNGRRQTVNLSPNSSILQILEEVCQKQNLNPDDFDVCHYKKPMDLTLPVRFANLSNNAQLELQPVKVARKDCLVTVGLQLESGERIMKDFVPSTSVWDVVEQCLNAKPDYKVNIDEKGEPVCIYMRQKLIGNAIKETTLRSLGLTKGSAIIRLLYRNPQDLSEQAHVSAPLSKPPKNISPVHSVNKLSSVTSEMECDPPVNMPKIDSVLENVSKNTSFSSDEPKLSPIFSFADKKKESVTNFNVTVSEEKAIGSSLNKSGQNAEKQVTNTNMLNKRNEEVANMPHEENMELDSTNMNENLLKEVEEIGAIHYIGGRHAVLYSLDDVTDVKKADLPDEFFQLTIDDVRYLMEEFKKARMDMENQPLLTKELRKRQICKKLGCYKQTVIRIYFPERLVLQAVFEAQETVQDVCDFIKNFLEDSSLNFYLYTTPPKEKKEPVKTLIESMLIPAAVMYFGSDRQNSSYLQKSLREQVSDPRAASLAAYESRKQAISETEEIPSNEPDEMEANLEEEDVTHYKAPGPSFSQPSCSIQTSEKVPKWLKLSKK